MQILLNKKLLLTLSALAYGLHAGGAHATPIEEESTIKRAYSMVKSAGKYAAVGVGSVYLYGDEQETLIKAQATALNYGQKFGVYLLDAFQTAYSTTSSALTASYTFAYDTYMPYHPTVVHYASEALKISEEGLSALKDTVIEHPYVALGVAAAFAASVGVTYAYGSHNARKAEQFLKEKQEAERKTERLLIAAKRKIEKSERAKEELAKQLAALKDSKSAHGNQTTSFGPIKSDHQTSSDTHAEMRTGPSKAQSGNVTFNLVIGHGKGTSLAPNVSESLASSFLPQQHSIEAY